MRRRYPIPLVVAALVLVALETVVRLVAPRLPDPLVWNDHEVQNKVTRIDALSRRDVASAVFAGSSSMNAALDPDLATRLVGAPEPTFNAALNGADLRSMGFWLTNVVAPRLRPRVIVVGTTSLEWNDNGITQRDFYRKLVRSDGARKVIGSLGKVERLESWLEDHSYLARYRTELRRPTHIVNGDPRAKEAAVGRLGTLHAIRSFQTRPYAIPPEFRRRTEQESFHRYAVGGVQLATLERLTALVRTLRSTLVVVKMPVTSDVFALHPEGRKDYEAYEWTLGRFVESHDVVFVDAAARIKGRRYFVDPIHLNARGARKFTELLAPELRRLAPHA